MVARRRRTAGRSVGVEVARRECVMLGMPGETDPGEALLGELAEAAGNVAFYRQLVQQKAQLRALVKGANWGLLARQRCSTLLPDRQYE